MSELTKPETEPQPELPPIRGPLQGLADVSQIISEHPVHAGTFVRGLTIGALVGAALAGSAIWRRWVRGGKGRTPPESR